MKIGPKYKIARRLGAPIFEKTQTQKFKARSEAKEGGKGKKRGGMMKSDFGRQMVEKQKARFMYGITEKQFSKYVKNIIESKLPAPQSLVFEALETRLDNVVFRLGFASTRRFARQVVSHGHVLVNGRKVTVPSFIVKAGDQIAVREGSKTNVIFKDIEAKMKEAQIPGWMTWDPNKKSAAILRQPTLENQDLLFDLGAIIEYYKR